MNFITIFHPNHQNRPFWVTAVLKLRFQFLYGFQFCQNFGSGSFRFPNFGVKTVGSSVSARIDQALVFTLGKDQWQEYVEHRTQFR